MKMIKKTVLIIFILGISLVFLYASTNAHAQSKNVTLHVVTKTIEKELQLLPDQTLVVKGEKATISVTGWEKDYAKLTLKLIAKNKVPERAKEELEAINYEIQYDEHNVVLSNYYLNTNKSQGIRSILLIEYLLYVPENNAMNIQNIYGTTRIKGISNTVKVTANFGNVFLSDIKGQTHLNSNYADMAGENLNGLTSQSEKANLSLRNISGNYKITASYGTIDFEDMENVTSLLMNGKNTEVNLNIDNFNRFNYTLSTLYDRIILPNEYKSGEGYTGKNKFEKTFHPNNPKIDISTSFSPITISSGQLTSSN